MTFQSPLNVWDYRNAEQTAEPLLVTESQAAQMLSICQRTMYELGRGGDVPVVRIGKRGKRYRVSDVRAYAEGRVAQGGAEP